MLRLKKGVVSVLWGLFLGTMVYSCGGVDSSVTSSCVAGQSIACGGPGGCAGFQTCKSDGTYAACDCGGAGADGGESVGDASTGDGSSAGDGSSGSDAWSGVDASDDDAGDFLPTDLPGLVLWLDGDGIVPKPGYPANLVHWLDQSGNSNDVTSACTDTCPDGLPGIDPAGAHGHDAIVLTFGSTMTITDSASLQLGTGDWGMAFVYKAGGLDPIPIYGKTNGSDPNIAVQAQYPNFAVSEAGQVATVALKNSGFGYYIARGPAPISMTGSTGSATGGDASGDVSNAGSLVSICKGQDDSVYPEIAEVLVVKGTVSDSDVAHLAAYFKKKYGL